MDVKEIGLNSLKPWEENPRVNDHAVDAVAKSIERFGFNVPILCDQNSMIIAGHTRWKAAKKLGLSQVSVIQIEMTDSQRKAFSIADNKTAQIADWDFPKLREIFDELRTEDINLNDLGFSDADLRRMLFNIDIDENEVPKIGEVSRAEFGQVYALDVHRLICGNACDPNTINLFLENQSIDMVISSPPRFNNLGMGDWDSYESFCEDIEAAIKCLSECLADAGVVFWTSGNSGMISSNFAGLYARLFENSGLQYVDTIAWVKPGINFDSSRLSHIRKNSVYYPARQWEPILVCRKSGPMKKMSSEGKKYMLNFQADVWEINPVNSMSEQINHPTVAPVELYYRALQAYSRLMDIIVDPFAGSGTTLIAVEKAGLGRKAYMVESNPFFCDIIIERWESYTGKHAELLSGVSRNDNIR